MPHTVSDLLGTSFRLNHYPPTPEAATDNVVAIHPQAYCGQFAILAQDDVGVLKYSGSTVSGSKRRASQALSSQTLAIPSPAGPIT